MASEYPRVRTTDEIPDPAIIPAQYQVPTPLDRGLRTLTKFADHGKLWFAISTIMALISKRQRRAALRGLVSLGGSSFIANSVLKPLIRRRRPDQSRVKAARQIGKRPWTSSFPSGHSASAAGFAVGAALESPWTLVPLAPITGAVAYSRVHVGVHYPSDVLAGVALGSTVAWAGNKLWPAKPYAPAQMAEAQVPALPEGEGLTVVVNEKSGTAGTAATDIAKLLPKARIVTWDPETDLAEALGTGMRALAVAGGDGTVASVAAQALRLDVPLAVFPAGTLNHFAGALGLKSFSDTASVVESGSGGQVSIARCGDDIFLNTVGIGGYPDMVRRRDKFSHRMGKWPAAAFALWRSMKGHEPLEVSINGQRMRVWAIFVGNGEYTPRGLAPAWRNDLATGVLDAQYLLADKKFARTIAVLASLIGLVERTKVFGSIQAPTLVVRSLSGPVPVAHDGEVSAPTDGVRIEVLPTPLRVYKP